MKRLIYAFFCALILTACDDGDILTVDLNFDGVLERCANNNENYLIYDLRTDPNESLSLIIARNTTNELLFTEPTVVDTPTVLTINGTSTRFLYRTYNRAVASTSINQELCDVIQPADLNIVESYEATSGTVEVTVTIADDDNDGVPSELEGRDPNGDGDFSDAQDTDLDGIPDYLDEDDDNDNVKTISEIDTANADGDNNPTTNPLDTDGDTTPNYLDEDDDGDLVPTIAEDEDGDQDPTNDISVSNGITIPYYLNVLETVNYGSPGVLDPEENTYFRTVTTKFVVKNIDLEILRTTEINFGTFTDTFEYPID